MMALCCASIELLEELLEKGSAGLVSDVGCGALCCAAALESASLNIFVNTQTLQDRSMAAHLDAQGRYAAVRVSAPGQAGGGRGRTPAAEGGLSMGEIWKGAPVAAACAPLLQAGFPPCGRQVWSQLWPFCGLANGETTSPMRTGL